MTKETIEKNIMTRSVPKALSACNINDYETTCDERHIFHIFHMLYVFYRAVVVVVPVEFPREILQHLYLF